MNLTAKSEYELAKDTMLKSKKLNWYWVLFYVLFWVVLWLAVVHTYVNHLPKGLTETDELASDGKHTYSFIGERAERILSQLAGIGPKVLGSVQNEEQAVNLLLNEIAKIKETANPKFQFDVDVQVQSGSFLHISTVSTYQALQNVIVKVTSEGVDNENYLLINSHFDTVPGSPGAGDAGAMCAAMLEVLRVITKSDESFAHPIVFLFNGAEENGLQASHAFITQHKWRKNCKALINLDAAGNSGREILFQSGPKHSWLMAYYLKVPHPFANTMGEEMFQAGLIPSDTDFRIFRDYGNVPGLDLAYIFNGYVYHTKYDRFSVVDRGSLQHTGDNLLELVRGLANAPELDETDNPSENSNVVFFDYLGWFVISYSETVSIIINSVVCTAALVAIVLSIFFMSRHSGLGLRPTLLRCATTFAVQILSIGLAIGLTLLVAFFMDAVGCSLSWLSETWLICGLYFCPMFFGMTVLQARYLERHKNRGFSLNYSVQLFLHAHCVCLIIVTIVLMGMGIRSAFMSMIAIFFDMIAVYINLITRWNKKPYFFAGVCIICQVLPFFYFTYVAEALYMTMIPMLGRIGTDANPDLQAAAIAILFSLLFSGFILPFIMFFRKTRTMVLSIAGICILTIILAVTPIGFPFRYETAPQRISMMHTHRVLRDATNKVRINETGILVRPEDRRIHVSDKYIEQLGPTSSVNDFCNDEMFCGLPFYSVRWHKRREASYWIPIDEYPAIPTDYPKLTLVSSESLPNAPNTKRFNFALDGPDHVDIYVRPKGTGKIVDWTFDQNVLVDQWEPPFFVYFAYGKLNTTFNFYVDIEKTISEVLPSIEIGIGGHWIHEEYKESNTYQEYIKGFPDYTFVNGWVSTYESWIY